MRGTLIGAGIAAILSGIPFVIKWWKGRVKDDDSNEYVRAIRASDAASHWHGEESHAHNGGMMPHIHEGARTGHYSIHGPASSMWPTITEGTNDRQG